MSDLEGFADWLENHHEKLIALGEVRREAV